MMMISFPVWGSAKCAPLSAVGSNHGQDQAVMPMFSAVKGSIGNSVILSDYFFEHLLGRTVCGLAILADVFWRTCQSDFLSAVFRHSWRRLFCGSNSPCYGGASMNPPFILEKEVFRGQA